MRRAPDRVSSRLLTFCICRLEGFLQVYALQTVCYTTLSSADVEFEPFIRKMIQKRRGEIYKNMALMGSCNYNPEYSS